MDCSYIKKRGWGNNKSSPVMEPLSKQEERKPKKSWKRSVMKKAGINWNEPRFLAADRQKIYERKGTMNPIFVHGCILKFEHVL